MKSSFIQSDEEGESIEDDSEDEAYVCLMAKDTSTSKEEYFSEVKTYDLLQTIDIKLILKETQAIEQGNARKMLKLQIRAKYLKEDDDTITQEIDILARNFQGKDDLLEGFEKCILNPDSKEQALRKNVKMSQNQCHKTMEKYQKATEITQKKIQQQKQKKILKKVWVSRCLQLNQEERPKICEHLTNSQGTIFDGLLKIIKRRK